MPSINCIIVDNNRQSCRRMEELLSKIPDIHVIESVYEADEAVYEIVKHKPDIVFMEIEMPGMSGFEIAKAVRLKNTWPKFIVVTEHEQYAIKALRHAAFDYLVKPVDIEDLKEAVDRTINNTSNNQPMKEEA